MNPCQTKFNQLSCVEMLELVLDGAATDEQRKLFQEHLQDCLSCFKNYELEKSIQEMLKKKCCGCAAPDDLVNKIKTFLQQNMA